MKRLMTTALTLALVASTASAALAQDRGRQERGGGPREDRGGRQEQQDRTPRGRPGMPVQPGYTAPQAAPTSPPAYTPTQAAPQQRGDGQRGDRNRGDNRGGDRSDYRRDDNRNDRGRNDNDRRGEQRQDWNRGDNDRRNDNDRRWDNNRGGDNRFDRDYRRPSQMRDRDRGRSYYNDRNWQRSYHAPRRFRAPPYRPPSGWYARSWGYGDFLPRTWFGSSYYLNWGSYGLPLPPIGTEWVRVGPDALLVDVWTGRVLTVYYGLFW
ncbi:RcnB family protein [Caulobacter sp. NIBR2454]|uniref:RcnB family protein n=1 Tax=Caulobacter sp. NIBR2454 TaxID=3015996 RepID=UPI0022B68C2D|nr:RcnB family protein [Caulobacter sp. NIBR2454]